MQRLHSLALLVAGTLLLFSSSCSGGGSGSGDGSGDGGTTTPNFGTGASYASLAIEVPDHGLPNQASVEVTWMSADGDPIEGSGTVVTASAIGVFVPELPEGSFTVSLSYEGAPVVEGTFESTGTVVPDEPAQYIADQLTVFAAALTDVRQQVEAGELPMDLLGFLDEGDMRLAQAQDELPTATAAEIDATAAWLAANADLLGLLQGGTDPLSAGGLCPGVTNTQAFQQLEDAAPRFVRGVLIAVAGVGVTVSTGGLGAFIGGTIVFFGITRALAQIDVIRDSIVTVGQDFTSCEALAVTANAATGIRPQQAFTVTLQGLCRGMQASDASGPQEQLRDLAVAVEEALLGAVDCINRVLEVLNIDPVTAPEVPSLPGVGDLDTLKMDPAHVQWMLASGDLSGPIDVAYAIAGDSLEITLQGGIPGEHITIDFEYEQIGVSLPSTQRIEGTMQNELVYEGTLVYTSVVTGDSISGDGWDVFCTSECQCNEGDTFDVTFTIQIDPYSQVGVWTVQQDGKSDSIGECAFNPETLGFELDQNSTEVIGDGVFIATYFGSYSGQLSPDFGSATGQIFTSATTTYVPEDASVTCTDASVWGGDLVR